MKANKGSNWTSARNKQEAEDIWYSRKVSSLLYGAERSGEFDLIWSRHSQMGLYAALDYLPGARCHVTDVCKALSEKL